MKSLVAGAFLSVLSFSNAVEAVTIQTFGPAAHNNNTVIMDATLGITGMSIESFSDPVLVPRLSVEFTNPNGGPFTTLPGSFSFNPAEAWDGDPVLINRPNQDNAFPYASTTFHVAGGTIRFGVGLGDFQIAGGKRSS